MDAETVRRIAVMLSWPLYERDPSAVFGPRGKRVYKKLLKLVHPDVVEGDDVAAGQATAALNALWARAEAQMEAGSYGRMWPGDAMFEYDAYLGSGDIAEVYEGTSRDLPPVQVPRAIKVAREAGDSDLMENEARILNHLASVPGFDLMQCYYPKVASSFAVSDLHINTFFYNEERTRASELLTLKQLGDYYDHRIDVRHIAWIWRRLLAALAFAHRAGIIHGGVTPDNILIDPDNHGLILIDWIHATRNQQPIRTLSREWRAHYPQEVIEGHGSLPGVDIYMAARAMIWACQDVPIGRVPMPLVRYFNWCLTASELGRPDQFEMLLDEFDRVLYEKLGWKREFVPMSDLLYFQQWW